MTNLIFTAFYFFLPAGVANSTPLLATKIPIIKNWNHPLDFNKKLNGKPVLGKSKTFRGIIAGILMGILTFYLQKRIYINSSFVESAVAIDYDMLPVLVLGFLLSAGALFGDMVKSFFKRRLGVASGAPWIPFDQIDFLLGAIFFTYSYIKLDFEIYMLILVIGVMLHFLSNVVAYLLKIKDVPY